MIGLFNRIVFYCKNNFGFLNFLLIELYCFRSTYDDMEVNEIDCLE